MTCEVCGSEYGNTILNLGNHPLCDDLIPFGSKTVVEKFHQLISLCEVCLTAHQMKPVEKEILFKPSYHYRGSLTKDVLNGMKTLAEDLRVVFDALDETATVLDIGCNDGSLLGIFKEKYSCITVGVDPTQAIVESGQNIDYKYNEYFSVETVRAILDNHKSIDLITFTNVFAHIEDLPLLLANLRMLIAENTTLVIENHYLGSILERNQFDTFYHEHPRTYSLRSFKYIANTLGMVITDVNFPSRYGGNIRVTMKKSGELPILSTYESTEDGFVSKFRDMQATYDTWLRHSQEVLQDLLNKGNVVGKALPGRAVMLISALGVNETQMPILFEQPNSPKVGNYVPGTQIEIRSDVELIATSPNALIVWSWHIIDEIVEYLDRLGYRGQIWVPLPEFRLYREAL